MSPLYTAIVFTSLFALLILMQLIYENGRLEGKVKKNFYRTGIVLIIAALSEWGALALNGASSSTIPLHTAIKCLDYIFTPVAAVFFVRLVSEKGIFEKPMTCILAFNAALELISAFTGWTFYVDAGNYYRHGTLYFIYVGVFALAFIYVIIEFWRYGKKFKRRNRGSLYSIFLFVSMGIALQEFVSSELRTAVLALSVGCILLFVHYSEFSQLLSDDDLSHQKVLVNTDAMTGMFSRYAYNDALNKYSAPDAIPEDFTVFSVDINGLKETNDDLGHEAGDELICGAAACITGVFAQFGSCYRTGGDEFIVLSRMAPEAAETAEKELRARALAWKGEKSGQLNLSAGFARASEHPDLSAEALVSAADKRMYADKALYYRETGKDRRRH